MHFVRGILMGAADIIPGVSGGTVALITGIYERLVVAVSHFDRRLVRLVGQRRWGAALGHVDARFLVPLLAGIACGMVGMTWVMHHLMSDIFARQLLLAVFFGVIAASASILFRTIHERETLRWPTVALLGGTSGLVALGISLLQPYGTEPTMAYLFVCGAVAICAMILPGISGAMILLIMGVYAYLMSIPAALVHGEAVGRHLTEIAVFGAGCAIGLLGFTRLLRWLLAHRHGATMAALCGFMVGALPNIWPFQRDTTPEIEDMKRKVFELTVPPMVDIGTWLTFAAMSIAFALVMLGTAIAARRRSCRRAASE